MAWAITAPGRCRWSSTAAASAGTRSRWNSWPGNWRDRSCFIWREEYKRSKGGCPQVLKPWFNRKNITLCTFRQPDGRMTTPELREDILAGFRWLKPYYHYF